MNRDVKNIKKVLVVLGIYGCVAQAAKKQAVEKGYEFVWKKPSISWHFNHPSGVVVDSSGNVYVADYYNNRIQKFRPITIITGSLTITSIPSSAKIYIDGDDTGQVTNHTFANLTPGTHTIKLTLSGCSDWYGAATV